jgi:hypothetical protein
VAAFQNDPVPAAQGCTAAVPPAFERPAAPAAHRSLPSFQRARVPAAQGATPAYETSPAPATHRAMPSFQRAPAALGTVDRAQAPAAQGATDALLRSTASAAMGATANFQRAPVPDAQEYTPAPAQTAIRPALGDTATPVRPPRRTAAKR